MRILWLSLFFFVLSFNGFTENVYQAQEKWGIDFPEGFQILDRKAEKFYTSFIDSSQELVVQVFLRKNSNKPEVEAQYLLNGLKTSKSGNGQKSFDWNSHKVYLYDITWKSDQILNRGYLMSIGRDKDCLLILFSCPANSFASNKLLAESILDSVYFNFEDQVLPGPLSSTKNDFIDRETSLFELYLDANVELQYEALARIFRLEFRRSFRSLESELEKLRIRFLKAKLKPEEQVQKIIEIIGAFPTDPAISPSAYKDPLSIWKEKTGDADGKLILSAIIFKYFGVTAFLILSPELKENILALQLKLDNFPQISAKNIQYSLIDFSNQKNQKPKSIPKIYFSYSFEPQAFILP